MAAANDDADSDFLLKLVFDASNTLKDITHKRFRESLRKMVRDKYGSLDHYIEKSNKLERLRIAIIALLFQYRFWTVRENTMGVQLADDLKTFFGASDDEILQLYEEIYPTSQNDRFIEPEHFQQQHEVDDRAKAVDLNRTLPDLPPQPQTPERALEIIANEDDILGLLSPARTSTPNRTLHELPPLSFDSTPSHKRQRKRKEFGIETNGYTII